MQPSVLFWLCTFKSWQRRLNHHYFFFNFSFRCKEAPWTTSGQALSSDNMLGLFLLLSKWELLWFRTQTSPMTHMLKCHSWQWCSWEVLEAWTYRTSSGYWGLCVEGYCGTPAFNFPSILTMRWMYNLLQHVYPPWCAATGPQQWDQLIMDQTFQTSEPRKPSSSIRCSSQVFIIVTKSWEHRG